MLLGLIGMAAGGRTAKGDLQVWHVLLAGPIEIEDRRVRMQLRVGRVDRCGGCGDVRTQFLMNHVRNSLQRVRPCRAGAPAFQGDLRRFGRRAGDDGGGGGGGSLTGRWRRHDQCRFHR